eukprot:14948694-Alexandrium_andersonii.AAC.1
MSASLVGSEMCIRDSPSTSPVWRALQARQTEVQPATAHWPLAPLGPETDDQAMFVGDPRPQSFVASGFWALGAGSGSASGQLPTGPAADPGPQPTFVDSKPGARA